MGVDLDMKYVCPEEARTRNGNLRYLEELRFLARKNRRNPTTSEDLIWKEIKKLSYPFLRQKPLIRFVLDFYCSKLLLAVEIDGDSHDKKKYYDKERDKMLEGIGIKTVRFRNERVLSDLNNVINELVQIMEIRERELTNPLFCQRGGRG
jgi:very-short-patch-repair endonuclease